MSETKVPINTLQAVETRAVRSAVSGFVAFGILNFITLCAYIFGADAWRQRFADNEIWTLWTPYWLWVGTFLFVAHTLFLYTVLVLIRSPMRTALTAISVIMFVIFFAGGAVFWGVELGLYCYGNQESFCYDAIAGEVWWNVWWALATYWIEVIVLLVLTVITSSALNSEGLRQMTVPYEAVVTGPQTVENPPPVSTNSHLPYFVPGLGAIGHAMLGMKVLTKEN